MYIYYKILHKIIVIVQTFDRELCSPVQLLIGNSQHSQKDIGVEIQQKYAQKMRNRMREVCLHQGLFSGKWTMFCPIIKLLFTFSLYFSHFLLKNVLTNFNNCIQFVSILLYTIIVTILFTLTYYCNFSCTQFLSFLGSQLFSNYS